MANELNPTVPTVFHIDLSNAKAGEDHWIRWAGKKYDLQAHTSDTLAKLRSDAPHMAHIPDEQITHYTATAVPMPANQAVRVHIRRTMKTTPGAENKTTAHLCAIHIPPTKNNPMKGDTLNAPINYVTTAQALIFHHGDLINNDANYTAIVYEHMDPIKSKATYALISNLATLMRELGPPDTDSGWALLQAIDAGQYGTQYMQMPVDQVNTSAGPAMTAVQVSTKNDTRLENIKWTLQYGSSTQGGGAGGGQSPDFIKMASVETKLTGDQWNAALLNTDQVQGVTSSITVVNSATGQVSLTMNNYYIRYVAAYIQFYDADGNAMSLPTWFSDNGDNIGPDLGLVYDTVRYLGYAQPVNNAFAIPILSDPGVLNVTFTFPDGATSASLYACGLGTGSNDYPKAAVIGGVMTGLCNLAIPAFMLGFAVAAQTYKPLYDLVGSKQFIVPVVTIGVAYFGDQFYQSAANKQMNWHAFSSLSQILFSQGATKALVWVEAQMAEGEVEDNIPFAGWIMIAINIATGIAQMAETIVEVCNSDWMIPNTISTTITTTVTINPDPRHNAFPQGDNLSLVTRLIYQNNTPTRVDTQTVPAQTPNTLTATFANNTLGGGDVKIQAEYYVGSWLAAQASTGWMENNADNLANVTLYLFEYPVPLTASSIYTHNQILTYQNSNFEWMPQSQPPTSTIANLNNGQTGNNISVLSGLTLSQRFSMLGSAWKASGMGLNSCVTGQGGIQLFAFQNTDIPGTTMNSVKFPSCGLDSSTQLLYDIYPSKFLMKDGNFVIDPNTKKPEPDPNDVSLGDYYIDPRKANNDPLQDGGYHLRFVTLDQSTPFNMNPNQLSYGRFPYYVDSAMIHPSGNVIGINRQYGKIMILQLETTGQADSDVPMAKMFAGQAMNYGGSQGRPGLLFQPIAVTCSYDGTIFILDQVSGQDTNIARIQAFDLNGNPVNCFADPSSGSPSPFFDVPTGVTYLDLACAGNLQSTVYLYVLYYTGDGSVANMYNMSIYVASNPPAASNPLVTTNGLSAANITVDMWNTLYALNYQMTTDANGKPSGPVVANAGPAGQTIPSISEWLPPTS